MSEPGLVVGTARPASPSPSRYEALDSLRGVAACGVVLYHINSTGILTNLPIARAGGLFVDFFFVLSGFVIAASYGEKLRQGYSLRAYLLLRLGRIYPLHLFMLLVIAAYALGLQLLDIDRQSGGGGFSGDRSIGYFFANLFLVQIFVPGGQQSFNYPSWSIAAEMWTYLLTALGLAFLRDRFRIVLVGLAVLSPVALVALTGGTLSGDEGSLFRCLFGFSIGMLTFDLHVRLRDRLKGVGRGGATLVEVAILALCAAWIAPRESQAIYLACPFLFALAVFVLAQERGAASGFLKLRPLRRLGRWSYSIYMGHMLCLTLLMRLLPKAGSWLGATLTADQVRDGGIVQAIVGPGLVPDLIVLLCLATVIAGAALTYRLIELPFRNASRRLAERIGGQPVGAVERIAPTM